MRSNTRRASTRGLQTPARKHGRSKCIILVNAAIDKVSGSREIYCVSDPAGELPPWTEQLASFQRQHIIAHEDRAPGVSRHLRTCKVPTVSFEDLLDHCAVDRLTCFKSTLKVWTGSYWLGFRLNA